MPLISEAAKILFGTTEVSAVYARDTKVWPIDTGPTYEFVVLCNSITLHGNGAVEKAWTFDTDREGWDLGLGMPAPWRDGALVMESVVPQPPNWSTYHLRPPFYTLSNGVTYTITCNVTLESFAMTTGATAVEFWVQISSQDGLTRQPFPGVGATMDVVSDAHIGLPLEVLALQNCWAVSTG